MFSFPFFSPSQIEKFVVLCTVVNAEREFLLGFLFRVEVFFLGHIWCFWSVNLSFSLVCLLYNLLSCWLYWGIEISFVSQFELKLSQKHVFITEACLYKSQDSSNENETWTWSPVFWEMRKPKSKKEKVVQLIFVCFNGLYFVFSQMNGISRYLNSE